MKPNKPKARRTVGRPPLEEATHRVTVVLRESDYQRALALGNEKVSPGVRYALERVRPPKA